MDGPPPPTWLADPQDRWRIAVLVLFCIGSLVIALVTSPIPQDLAYHAFSDTRTVLAVPNFFNVASNVPFLLIGCIGLAKAVGASPVGTGGAWILFFLAIGLVGIGSSYYHWWPQNASLIWDRLPMTTGFMALFVILIGEYFDRRAVRWLLLPAVVTGASSVLYWHLTDDLRFYGWVQFMPLGFLGLLLLLFPSRFAYRKLLLVALIFYIAAKVLEYFDSVIYERLAGSVSGHTLKHLFAAIGCFVILILFNRIRAVSHAPALNPRRSGAGDPS